MAEASPSGADMTKEYLVANDEMRVYFTDRKKAMDEDRTTAMAKRDYTGMSKTWHSEYQKCLGEINSDLKDRAAATNADLYHDKQLQLVVKATERQKNNPFELATYLKALEANNTHTKCIRLIWYGVLTTDRVESGEIENMMEEFGRTWNNLQAAEPDLVRKIWTVIKAYIFARIWSEDTAYLAEEYQQTKKMENEGVLNFIRRLARYTGAMEYIMVIYTWRNATDVKNYQKTPESGAKAVSQVATAKALAIIIGAFPELRSECAHHSLGYSVSSDRVQFLNGLASSLESLYRTLAATSPEKSRVASMSEYKSPAVNGNQQTYAKAQAFLNQLPKPGSPGGMPAVPFNDMLARQQGQFQEQL
jgi:hypothetical protein